MHSFKDLALSQFEETSYREYKEALYLLETSNHGIVSENILNKISSGIKKKIDFIKELTTLIGSKLDDIIKMFKNKKFFKIFSTIGFNVKKIISLYKTGVKTFNSIQNILAEKIADLGGVKYIKKNLGILDDFFNEHPLLKKLGGIAVAGLLFYIWLNMSYDPLDIEWSLSFEDMIKALSGSFSLADLFAGPEGIKMLIYLAIGVVTGGVWYYPGTQVAHIISGVMYGLWKTIIKDKSIIIQKPKLKKILIKN